MTQTQSQHPITCNMYHSIVATEIPRWTGILEDRIPPNWVLGGVDRTPCDDTLFNNYLEHKWELNNGRDHHDHTMVGMDAYPFLMSPPPLMHIRPVNDDDDKYSDGFVQEFFDWMTRSQHPPTASDDLDSDLSRKADGEPWPHHSTTGPPITTNNWVISGDYVNDVRHNTYKYLYILIFMLDTSMQGIDFLHNESLVIWRPLIHGHSLHVPPQDADLTLAFLVNDYWFTIFDLRMEKDIPYNPRFLDSFWNIKPRELRYYATLLVLEEQLYLLSRYSAVHILSIQVYMRPWLTPQTIRVPPPHTIIILSTIYQQDKFVLMTHQ